MMNGDREGPPAGRTIGILRAPEHPGGDIGKLVRSRREGKLVIYGLTDDGRRLVEAVLGIHEPDGRRQPPEVLEAST